MLLLTGWSSQAHLGCQEGMGSIILPTIYPLHMCIQCYHGNSTKHTSRIIKPLIINDKHAVLSVHG